MWTHLSIWLILTNPPLSPFTKKGDRGGLKKLVSLILAKNLARLKVNYHWVNLINLASVEKSQNQTEVVDPAKGGA
jgi:hypothetical protein